MALSGARAGAFLAIVLTLGVAALAVGGRHRGRGRPRGPYRPSIGTVGTVVSAAALALVAPSGFLTQWGTAAAAAGTMVQAAPLAPAIPGGSQLVGPLAPSTELRLAIAMAPSDPAGLEAFATAVSTPGTSQYHRYLAPGEVEARFGPAESSLAAVRSWLTGAGLSVDPATGDGLDLPLRGTVGQIESAFETHLAVFTLASGRRVYANLVPPKVPASLRPGISAVLGLDDLVQAHNQLAAPGAAPVGQPHPAVPTSAARTAPGALPPGAASPCAAASATSGETADQLAQLYALDPLYARGTLGQGTTVALFELSTYEQSDVATFESCYGIRTPVSTVAVDGGSTSASGQGEATLDIDMVAGLAPDTNILVYEGNTGMAEFPATYDVYAQMVQQNRAQVISTSWGVGHCEADMVDGGVNQSLVEAPLFQEMAAQGQSMFAAAGDQGSAACSQDINSSGQNEGSAPNPYALAVMDPGDQPFVTAVGGTQLTSGPGTGGQEVWNCSNGYYPTCGDGSGWQAPFTGTKGANPPAGFPQNSVGLGGISAFFQMPPWQVGADTSANSSGVPCGAPVTITGTVDCREEPDVSALAWEDVMYQGGGWSLNGGTSAAAPEWAALIALADQGTPQGRLGMLSPALYRAAADHPGDFSDITAGNNDFLAMTGAPDNYSCTYDSIPAQPCYEATPGYDMASGLGTPVGYLLAAELDRGQVGITTASLPQGAVGVPYRATLDAAGGNTPYTWGISTGSLPPGLTLTTSGTISGIPIASGTYGFTVMVSAPGGPVPGGGTDLVTSARVALVLHVAPPRGYWLVASDGGVFSFGDAAFAGSMGGQALNRPIIGVAATPDGGGYWLVASDGGVFSFGDAAFAGSMGGQALNRPIIGVAATPDGGGYWLVASDGGVFSFGDAAFAGSMGGQALNRPIIGVAATPDGGGYWLVASDGGVFSFGDAAFAGSMGGQALNRPIIGVAATPDGGGYWLVASDGGVFSFGDAAFAGSMGGQALNRPIIGVAATPDGGGYWLVASDGGVFSFGDAAFAGSMGGQALNRPIIGVAARG